MAKPQAGARLSRSARERQIMDGAAQLIVEQGSLPLPLEALSQRVGISKALIYAYFPTQQALANRILREHLEVMAAALEPILRSGRPGRMAADCAAAYFEHVARHGPLLHILLSDPFLARAIEPDLRALYGRLMRRLAMALREQYGVARSDAIAAVHILAALPEEAGAMVFAKRLDPALGLSLALEMTEGGLQRLPPRPAA
ncbi:TetR/AcrR family transcriptional regulator [Phenylobacterium koreense]|uniref:AcrR family transcriptional regulator n=1 Tax=Phenylobacterium koreense TaxID=266125 RepID=A0ABV2END1_9CAUL